MIGTKIANFEIVSELGSGGMGTVYKAKDLKLNRFVAIKALHSQATKNNTSSERFRNEAEVSAKINHPNVATLHNFLEIEGKNYIVMELVEGLTLEDLLLEKGKLSAEEATEISIQILKGLSAAHEKKILHRDLKPANIMISKDGYVKIMDFGIALMENASRLTTVNKVIGTINYMAPEIITGSSPSTESDLYAVGVMFHEMLTGDLTFNAKSEVSLMYKIVHEEAQLHFTKKNKGLEKIINKLLSKDAGKRYKNSRQVIQALTQQKGRKQASVLDQKHVNKRNLVARSPLSLIKYKSKPREHEKPSIKSIRSLIFAALSCGIIILLIISFTLKNDTKGSSQKEQASEVIRNDEEYSFQDGSHLESDLDGYEEIDIKPTEPIVSQEYADLKYAPKVKRQQISTVSPPTTPVQEPSTNQSTSHSESVEEISTNQKGENKARPSQNQEPKKETSQRDSIETALSQEARLEPKENIDLKITDQQIKTFRIPRQNISLVFQQDISSKAYEEGDLVQLVTAEKISSDGISIIPAGSQVRAMVKRKKTSNSGKVTFGINFLEVQAINGEWLSLKYPEYTDIQKDEVVFRKGTRISKVTLTSTKISIKI